MNRFWIFLLSALLFLTAAEFLFAAEEPQEGHEEEQGGTSWLIQGNTKIWLEDGVTIQDRKDVLLNKAVDGTEKQLRPQFLKEFTLEVRKALTSRSLNVVLSRSHSPQDSIELALVVTKFDPGSALERWMAPGMGSTVCIARVTILDPFTAEILGEIISWQHVPAGGLFSAGAYEYVPRSVAKAIAEALAGEIRR